MEHPKIPKIINLEKIFQNKNPGLYKLLPGFVFKYLKRAIHQDRLNEIIIKGQGLNGLEFANLVLSEMGVETECYGLEHIPAKGPVIIVANHPLGGLDAMALIRYIGQKRTDLKYLVNDILTQLSNFEEIFIPVNKFGTNAKSNLAYIDSIYSSDAAILVFPAGQCSRRYANVIEDREWQKSFVSKAQKYEHPILPVFIDGKNSAWFYTLAQIRTFLGIKANLEMFYLADEMFKQKGKRIHLHIGPLIDPKKLGSEQSSKGWAAKIRTHVYGLKTSKSSVFIR